VLKENPWWGTGEVPRDFLPSKSRFAFKRLRETIGEETIDLITGPRYAGKSTLMFQLIDHLLGLGVDAKNILYHPFDEERVDLLQLVNDYQKAVLKKKLRDERVYMFLDEICKLKNWKTVLGLLRDANPKLKLVISSSIDLAITAKEKAAFAVHRIPPLTFAEFLHLKGERIPRVEGVVEAETFEGMLRVNLRDFLKRGFPEIIETSDRFARRYTQDLVLGRIIYRDIWETFGVKDMGLVRDLSQVLLSNPSYTVNVNQLASELGKARKTVRNVLDYLRSSFVIKELTNFRGGKLAPSRKNQKVYPTHCSFAAAEDEEVLAKTLVCNEIDTMGYWSSGSSEIDFLARVEGRIIPVAVNLKDRITSADLRGVRNFCRRFGVERGVVVTREDRGRMNWAELVPLHLFAVYPEKYLISGLRI
jgi:hypothetical protein